MVDTRPPACYVHLQVNLKKLQMREVDNICSTFRAAQVTVAQSLLTDDVVETAVTESFTLAGT